MENYTSSRGFSTPTIPAGLRALPQWIVWRYDADGKKRPVHPERGRLIGYPHPAE